MGAGADRSTTPLLLSAFGPKGKQVVAEMYDGGSHRRLHRDGRRRRRRAVAACVMTAGTVLDDGEDRRQRARRRRARARGTWCATTASGRRSRTRSAACPAVTSGCAAVNAERPEGERHLAVHEGHVTNVMPRDRDVLVTRGRRRSATTGWVGTRRGDPGPRPRRLEAAGAHRDPLHPAGDVERELRTFACAADVRGQNSTSSSSSSSGSWCAAAVHSRIAGRARIVSQYPLAASSSSTS